MLTSAERTYPEVLLRHSERVEHLGVDLLVLEIDEIHLLADLLQRRLRAERRQIAAHVTVRLGRHLLQIDVVRQLHVLGVNAQNLQATRRVGDADVDFSVEATW